MPRRAGALFLTGPARAVVLQGSSKRLSMCPCTPWMGYRAIASAMENAWIRRGSAQANGLERPKDGVFRAFLQSRRNCSMRGRGRRACAVSHAWDRQSGRRPVITVNRPDWLPTWTRRGVMSNGTGSHAARRAGARPKPICTKETSAWPRTGRPEPRAREDLPNVPGHPALRGLPARRRDTRRHQIGNPPARTPERRRRPPADPGLDPTGASQAQWDRARRRRPATAPTASRPAPSSSHCEASGTTVNTSLAL